MGKVFAATAIAALGLIGCAGAREVRVEDSRAEQQTGSTVVLASASSSSTARPKKKADDATGGSGGAGIDEALIAPIAVSNRGWLLDGEKVSEQKPAAKKSEAKDRAARRVLQPGAVKAEPAE